MCPSVWVDMLHNGGAVKYLDGFFTVNGIFPDDTYDAADLKRLYGPLPDLKEIRAARNVKPVRELIRAWDPVAQKTVWEHETSSGMRGYDGGVMSTAGNLVFQGRGSGGLWVYAADTGKVLKVIETGSHIMAAPTTYAVNGEQYVAVQVGYGGTGHRRGAHSAEQRRGRNTRTPIASSRSSSAAARCPHRPSRVDEPFDKPPAQNATRPQINAGEIKFIQECSRCHALGLSTHARSAQAQCRDCMPPSRTSCCTARSRPRAWSASMTS